MKKLLLALVLVIGLLAFTSTITEAEGEDEKYRAFVYAYGYSDTGYCRVYFSYRNFYDGPYAPYAYIYQSGAGCPYVSKILRGSDMPADMFSFEGPVDQWLVDSFDLEVDGITLSLDSERYATSVGEEKTSYDDGYEAYSETKTARFNVDSWDLGETSIDTYYGYGYVTKYEGILPPS